MNEEEIKAAEPESDTSPADAPPTGSVDVGAADAGLDAELASRVKELEVHYAAKDEAFQDLENQYRRLAADFENFRRRQVQERENLIKSAGERVLERFLEVLDNFERALQVGERATEPQQVLTGVSLIYRQIQDFLNKEGVVAMEAKGSPFDPNMHEAVIQESSDDQPDQTVLDEFRKGYLLNGRVLRHAMVKIADNPSIPALPPKPAGEAGSDSQNEPARADSSP